MSMTTRAAICREPGRPWEITEIELDEPRANEVRIKFMAAGMCHSDDHIQKGDAPMRMPVVGGHEGAGIVDAVGEGVTRVAVGDHVVCSFIPACGSCRYCSTGRQNLCDAGKNAATGEFPDGTFRFHKDGEDLGGLCVLGTFSQYAVVGVLRDQDPDDIPFEVAALVGCGVPTGWGSAVYAAGVRAGPDRGGVRRRRRRHQRRAGRPVRRGAARGRRRPGRVQARHGQGASAPRIPSPPPRRRTTSSSRPPGAQLADHAIITVGVLHDEVDRRRRSSRGQERPGDDHRGRQRRSSTTTRGMLIGYQRRIQGAIFGGCNPLFDMPAAAEPVPLRRPQARRADHPHVQAGRGQPGLPGHAGRQEHPRRDHPRALRTRP